MSFWKRLFDTPDTISEGVRAVINTGDALVYTDEEKAEFGQKVRDWMLAWQQATSGQNVARRLIALSVTAVWLLEAVVTAVLSVWAAINPEVAPAAAAIESQFARLTMIEGMILTYYYVPNKIGEAVARVRQMKQ